MNILDIIDKKRAKKHWTKEEIDFFVGGVCDGSIKDFQTTSALMAICINGMNFDETFNLTMAMAKSGKMLNLDDVGVCVDKHSTGGVSDTTTLIVVPTLASLGVKVAKMSGRSLGFTGGTADKMEVFDGYQTEISTQKFKNLIKKNNASIITQSAEFALADKIIYNLRSQSGTVESMSLIASSIMSKKIACGAKVLLLDVKYGSGAFMKTLSEAKKLARLMTKIGKLAGIKVCAVISSMEQPLTNYVGNNLEVYSAIKVLQGQQNDLAKLSVFICAKVLVLCGQCQKFKDALKLVAEAIESGKSLQMLKKIVASQGGSVEAIENPEILLPKNKQHKILSNCDGVVKKMDTAKLGGLAHSLQFVGTELVRQDDVGVILHKRLGERVKKGDELMTIFFNNKLGKDVAKEFESIYQIGKGKRKSKLIDYVIE